MPDRTVTKGIEELTKDDILKKGNNVLRTDQRRMSFFKNNFNYVDPLPLYLGINDSGKQCFAQYVPIKETLTSLSEIVAFKNQYEKAHFHIPKHGASEDVWDGQNTTDNVLLKTETSSVALILYQDAFEVVNLLGLGQKKHKVLAVYLTFGDYS